MCILFPSKKRESKMDIKDDLFDVSYGKTDEKERGRLLKRWVSGDRTVISLGKEYTERMLAGWHSIALSFDNVARGADDSFLLKLIEEGFVQHQPHGPVFNNQNLVRNERSDDDSKLLVAIINMAIKEARKASDKYRSQGSLFAVVATQLPLIPLTSCCQCYNTIALLGS